MLLNNPAGCFASEIDSFSCIGTYYRKLVYAENAYILVPDYIIHIAIGIGIEIGTGLLDYQFDSDPDPDFDPDCCGLSAFGRCTKKRPELYKYVPSFI